MREVIAVAPALNGQRTLRITDMFTVTAGGVVYAVHGYASVPLDNSDHGVALLLSVTGQPGGEIQRPRCSIWVRGAVALTESKPGQWPWQYARSWTRIEAGKSKVDWMPVFVFDSRYASSDLSGITCLFEGDDAPIRFTIRAP